MPFTQTTVHTNINIFKQLIPFPNGSFLSYYQNIICVDFTFHLQPYNNNIKWMNYILPIITLIVTSSVRNIYSIISIFFHLVTWTFKYIFLQFIYVYWYSFISLQLSSFVQNDNKIILAVNNAIVKSFIPTPETSLHNDSSIVDGWFSIPFQYYLHTTHIRVSYSSEILTLYNLPFFISLYPSLLSSKHMRYLILYILPFFLSKHIASVFLSHIFSPPIFPPIFYQSISSFFTLQPFPAREQWSSAYKGDPVTNFLMDHLHHNILINMLCIT